MSKTENTNKSREHLRKLTDDVKAVTEVFQRRDEAVRNVDRIRWTTIKALERQLKECQAETQKLREERLRTIHEVHTGKVPPLPQLTLLNLKYASSVLRDDFLAVNKNSKLAPREYVLLMSNQSFETRNGAFNPGAVYFVHRRALQSLLNQAQKTGTAALHPISRKKLDEEGIRKYLQHLEQENIQQRSKRNSKPRRRSVSSRLSAAVASRFQGSGRPRVRPVVRSRTEANNNNNAQRV